MAEAPNFWEGDLLKRKESAQFLYRYVTYKCSQPHYREQEALCFAVDGEWGSGKSFFLKRWATELRHMGHPVIEFDSWVNDLSEDPLIGFMAELRDGLKELESLLPVGDKAPHLITEMVGGFRRAFIPTIGALAKGYLSSKVGKDVIDGILTGDEASLEALDGTEIAAGLDAFLEKALDEHKDIKLAVHQFKARLKNILDLVEEKTKTQLPLFVIVDELDRCRPSYAIRLLEGIKHLFGAPNVCFVLATNMQQMSESVCAVYGSGFDGIQYLKRFFAFEYVLPTPSTREFCESCVSTISLDGVDIRSGLPTFMVGDEEGSHQALASALVVVAEAFSLKPRSILQVVSTVEAACLGLKERAPVYALYLCFLAVLRIKAPRQFDEFCKPGSLTDHQRQDVLSAAGFSNVVLQTGATTSSDLINTIIVFRDFALQNENHMRQHMNSHDRTASYPATLKQGMAAYFYNYATKDPKKLTPLAYYPEVLKQAGYLVSSQG